MADQETIVAVYDDFDSANKAIQDLTNDGISRDDIGLAVNNGERKGDYSNIETNVEQYEDVTGAQGGLFGAVTGGLAGAAVMLTAIVIPGIGPLVAAGPLVALLGGAAGAAIGGTAGAISGGVAASLIHLGISDDEAEYYAEAIKRGNALVTVTARDDNQASLISDILRRYQPVNLKRRVNEWREKGWQGFDRPQDQVDPIPDDDRQLAAKEMGNENDPHPADDESVRRFPYIPPTVR